MSGDSFRIISGFRGKHRKKGKFEWGTYDFFSCLFCSYRGSCGNDITTHYSEIHNTEICSHVLNFRCNEDFKAWKTYVLSRGNYTNEWPKTKKDMRFSSVIGIAWCAEGVDHFSETPLREIRGVCPSSIRATLQTDGSIIVDYISTHLGHRTNHSEGNGTKKDQSLVSERFHQDFGNACHRNSHLQLELQNCFKRTEELPKGSCAQNDPERRQSIDLFECGTPKIEPDIDDTKFMALETNNIHVKLEEDDSEFFELTEDLVESIEPKQEEFQTLVSCDTSISSPSVQHTCDELAVSCTSNSPPDLTSREPESKITQNRRSERLRKKHVLESHCYDQANTFKKANKNTCKEMENLRKTVKTHYKAVESPEKQPTVAKNIENHGTAELPIRTVMNKYTNTDRDMLCYVGYPRLSTARCGPLSAEEYDISQEEATESQRHRGTQTLVAPFKCYASPKDFKTLRSPDRSSKEDEEDSKPSMYVEEAYELFVPSVAPSSLVCPLDFSRFMPAVNKPRYAYVPKNHQPDELSESRHRTSAKPATIAERYVRFGRFMPLNKYVMQCKTSANQDGNSITSSNSLLTDSIRGRPIAEVAADAVDLIKHAGPWRHDDDTTELVRDSETLLGGFSGVWYPDENLTDFRLQKFLNKRIKTH
ncbi:hypothetical protein GE061_019075 [Apolygus lucorum]|uniref:Uncharacterized protein n=1 Tax=Apolygus lucorum TaxID=248454 RepID=A0A6A4JP02_APOLU|nr:hypothetical protein GE061_019075 [Apolygus lucorum]